MERSQESNYAAFHECDCEFAVAESVGIGPHGNICLNSHELSHGLETCSTQFCHERHAESGEFIFFHQ